MRFPKETRALIHEAYPNPVTVPWPSGERQPQPNRLYWLQSAEDLQEAEDKEKRRREYSPETHAEVMAGMKRRAGTLVKEPPKPKRRRDQLLRPKAGDLRILVIDVEIQERGWTAKVVLYEDPDPVRHTGLKTRVKGGAHPIDKEWGPVAAELEQEELEPQSAHDRRLEEESVLKVAHQASVDRTYLLRQEKKLLDSRRKGHRSPLKEEAIERARKREAQQSAAAAV